MICSNSTDPSESNGNRQKFCTCRVKVGVAQGGFKVELVVDEHSCDSNWRSQNEAQTKALVKEKIAELRRQINLSAMAPAGRSTEYATATQLKAEIDLLLSTTSTVKLPSPLYAFSSERALLIHLNAFARQRGFAVARSSTPAHFHRMICSKRNCHYEIRAELGDDQKWRIVSVSNAHTHSISEPASPVQQQVTADMSDMTALPDNGGNLGEGAIESRESIEVSHQIGNSSNNPSSPSLQRSDQPPHSPQITFKQRTSSSPRDIDLKPVVKREELDLTFESDDEKPILPHLEPRGRRAHSLPPTSHLYAALPLSLTSSTRHTLKQSMQTGSAQRHSLSPFDSTNIKQPTRVVTSSSTKRQFSEFANSLEDDEPVARPADIESEIKGDVGNADEDLQGARMIVPASPSPTLPAGDMQQNPSKSFSPLADQGVRLQQLEEQVQRQEGKSRCLATTNDLLEENKETSNIRLTRSMEQTITPDEGFAKSRSSTPVFESSFTPSSSRASNALARKQSQALRFATPNEETLMLPPPLKKRKLNAVPVIKVSAASPSTTPSFFSRVSNALRSLWPRRNDNVKPSFVKNASPPSLLLTTPTSQQLPQNVAPNSQVRILDYTAPPQELSYPPSQYASFLRSFGVTDVESTISNLESTGIDSLETLVLVASMEKVVIDALANRMGDELGQLIRRVQNSTTAASEDSGEKDAGYSDGGRASCKRQKRVSYVGDDEASDGSYSQDSLTSDSDADVPSSSTTSKVVKVKAGPSGIGRSLVSASRRMPSARELLFEIVNLKTNTLSLPLPTETFSEPPHQLLATLYAYAQQNGFRLQRSTKADVKTSLKMCCGSKARDLEQRCPYSISARRDQDVWRILPLTTTQHNHTLSSSSALPSSLTTAAPAATSTSSLSQTQNLSNLPSYATRSSHSQPFVVLSTYQPLLPPRFESPISTQNASSLDLASLLRPFHSSPFEVQRSFDYLHSIKVDSVETLTQLLMIEDEGFERLVKGIENEIGKKLRTMREDLHEELAK
ncbi:hypothetical protein JCM5353_000332 [Sporobolomyces roseus]